MKYILSVLPNIETANQVLRTLQLRGGRLEDYSILAAEEVLNDAPATGSVAAMLAADSDIPIFPLHGLAALGFLVNQLISTLFMASSTSMPSGVHQALTEYNLSRLEANTYYEAVKRGYIVVVLRVVECEVEAALAELARVEAIDARLVTGDSIYSEASALAY